MAAIDVAKEKFEAKIRTAVEKDLHCKGVALFSGLDTGTVCASASARKWKEKMARPAEVAEKWKTNYLAAFSK